MTGPKRARRVVRWGVGGLVAVLFALSLGGLTRVPYQAEGADAALLRLSWRFRAAATETCRSPTQEELARLPAHMRPEEVCERRVPPRTLRLAVDGRVLEETVVEAGGAREDRPLFVHREIAMNPGVHRLHVSFLPSEAGQGEGEASGDPDVTLEAEVSLRAGEVALVTYDPEGRRLVLR